MKALVVSGLPPGESPVEMVERKGLGHPDSICDALAENLSRNLCLHYRERFGEVLHHNVDKALLCGGSAAPAFGGGEVLAPMDIYLSGRAVAAVGGAAIPVRDIAIEGSRAWLRRHMHALDAERHVRLHDAVRPGSLALGQLFARRGAHRSPLANDTSFGVGYAPMSRLERLVLDVECGLNARDRLRAHPAWGEDIKVMGVRRGDGLLLTISCAMIGAWLASLDAYRDELRAIAGHAEALARAAGFDDCRIEVNAADDLAAGSVYLTVTGTSAEAGDDGEVGRGNRVNGLITPYRPMSLEAAAGKNPVTHVGKIYNVVAGRVARRLVETIPEISAAECYLVSQIGRPVDDPAIAHVRVATRGGMPANELEPRIAEVVSAGLAGIPSLLDEFVAGSVAVA